MCEREVEKEEEEEAAETAKQGAGGRGRTKRVYVNHCVTAFSMSVTQSVSQFWSLDPIFISAADKDE